MVKFQRVHWRKSIGRSPLRKSSLQKSYWRTSGNHPYRVKVFTLKSNFNFDSSHCLLRLRNILYLDLAISKPVTVESLTVTSAKDSSNLLYFRHYARLCYRDSTLVDFKFDNIINEILLTT